LISGSTENETMAQNPLRHFHFWAFFPVDRGIGGEGA
jgi:hypothetical protein